MLKQRFVRWDTLLLQYLKRDYKKLIIWILALGLFAAGFVPAFEEISKGEGLIGMFETLQNPAMISMIGPTPIKEAQDYTLGAMYAHEMLLFTAMGAMVMSILHVVGRTRKEEDQGLMELVRSFQIGRQANSFAVIKENVVINLILTLFIGVVMTSFGADSISAQGSFLFAATIGMAGIMGGAIALVMAQIMPSSSGATGSSLGIMGALYLLRGATDLSNVDLSMINPMGWTYLTYPFTNNNWMPILFAFIFSVLMVVIAFALEGGRDMGAGYLPERNGREHAKKSLLSVPGLFFKINKGVIIAWLITFFIMGATFGSIFGDMQTFLNSNDIVKQMFTYAGFSMEESFAGTIMMILVSLVCALPIVIVNKLFSIENNLNLSQLYATKATRTHFYWTTIILATLSGIVGILLTAGGLGGTAIATMGDTVTMEMSVFLASGFNLLPVVLFYTGLAAFAIGWLPRLGKLIYVYLGYAALFNYFLGILDLPDWFIKTAAINWLPKMPIEDFDMTVFIGMTAISIALMILGYIGYIRRDMREGA